MSVTYCHRPNAFRKQLCCTLDDDAVRATEGDRERTIPLSDITGVRVQFARSRIQRNRYRMRILHTGGQLTLINESYKGIASFEQHNAEYARFARALHDALRRMGSKAVFRSGMSTLGYAATVLMLAAVGAMLYFSLPLFFAGYGPVGIVTVKLIVIVSLLPVLGRYMVKNWPRRYDPAEVPAAALPT